MTDHGRGRGRGRMGYLLHNHDIRQPSEIVKTQNDTNTVQGNNSKRESERCQTIQNSGAESQLNNRGRGHGQASQENRIRRHNTDSEGFTTVKKK